MTMPIPASITGGAQTGFTTPGYTLSTDKYPDVNGNQSAVTALTGTQTNVRVHAVSDPFTIAVFRPKNPKALQSPNPVTGKYGTIPKNTSGIIVRKGVNFAANQAPQIMTIRTYLDVPAGGDAYDSANVRAAVSCYAGFITQGSAGIGDTAVNGVL